MKQVYTVVYHSHKLQPQCLCEKIEVALVLIQHDIKSAQFRIKLVPWEVQLLDLYYTILLVPIQEPEKVSVLDDLKDVECLEHHFLDVCVGLFPNGDYRRHAKVAHSLRIR